MFSNDVSKTKDKYEMIFSIFSLSIFSLTISSSFVNIFFKLSNNDSGINNPNKIAVNPW